MLDQMIDIRYWQTQWVLKKKWFLNRFLSGKGFNFTKYIVLCDPRTGSTWLHTLLNSSPYIVSYGEYLTEHDVPTDLHSTIWKSHHRSVIAVGCKIFYEQLLDNRYSHIRSEIISDPNIKIIDLYRESHLEMFVSLKQAEKSNRWSSTKGKEKTDTAFRVDHEEYEGFINKIGKARQEINAQLENHMVYHLAYEQLLANEADVLREVQEFINVLPGELFSLLKKQSNLSLRHRIENFDDLA